MPTDLSRAGDSIPFAHPEALTEPEKLLAAYFSSSNLGLCILDSEMHYLAVNNTLAAMNGVPAEDHIGKRIQEVLGDAAGVIEAEFRRAFSTGEPVANIEISVKLPTRTEEGHWIEHYFPIKDGSGTVQRIAVVVIEITEQKKLERSLQDVGGKLHIRLTDRIAFPLPPNRAARYQNVARNETLLLGLRPEHIAEARVHAEPGVEPFDAVLDVTEPMGMETLIYFTLEGTQICGRVNPNAGARDGGPLRLAVDLNNMHLLNEVTGVVI